MNRMLSALLVPTFLLTWSTVSARETPSFDCTRVEAGGIGDRICRDAALARLDRRLAEVFAEALKKSRNEVPPTLRAEQRGWIKGRDDCWKSSDVGACVALSYERRMAELQARYRLLPPTGPVRYACNGDMRNELQVSWFDTQPATLYAERGDSVSLMFREAKPQPIGDVLYVGRNESLRMRQPDQVVVRWGVDAPEMTCERQP